MEELISLKCYRKITKCNVFFLLLFRGGQDKPARTTCIPGVKIIKVGGKISRDLSDLSIVGTCDILVYQMLQEVT